MGRSNCRSANLEARLARLKDGHNPRYWVEKLRRNVQRDRAHDEELRRLGWEVLRLWETDILKDPGAAANLVEEAVKRPARV